MMILLPYVIITVGLSISAIIIAIRLARLHPVPVIRAGALDITAAALWLLTSGLAVSTSSLPMKFLIFQIGFFGIVLVEPCWLTLSVIIAGYGQFASRRNILALSIIPIVTLALVFTNGYHGLMFSKVELNAANPLLPLNITPTPAFLVLVIAYSYALDAAGVVALIKRLLVSRSSFRPQIYLLLAASLTPWIANMAYLSNPDLFGYVEPTSLILTVAGAIVLWRTARWAGLYVAPIAHEVMVDNMSDPVIVLDYEKRVVDVNPAAEKLICRSYSEVVGQLIENVWDEWPRVSKVLDDKTLGAKEISFGTHDMKRLYELQSIRLPGFTAEEINLLITLRDVTYQKMTEEKLRLYSEHLEQLVNARTADLAASERKYRLLLDNMADSVFTINLEGELTFVSPQTEEVTGYTPQQLLSMNIKQLVAPEDLPAVMNRLEMRGRGTTGLFPMQFNLIRPDGTRRCIEIHTKLLTDERGTPVGVQGVARDITERVKIELALKESEAKFRELADLLPQPVFEIDREAKFTLVNRAGFALTGYTEEDMRKGVSAFELVVQEEREKVAEAIQRVMAGESPRGYEFTVLRKDGTTFPTILHASRIMRGDDVVGLRAVAADISERKQMEEALRHSEARFRELANMLPQIVFETDISGNYTFANRSGLIAGGYTEAEALNGLNAFQTFAEQDRERAMKNIVRILMGQGVGPNEYTALRKDGTTFPVLVHSTRVVREGKVVGVRGVAMDITEQKRMEAELLKAKHLAALGEAAAMVGHDLRNPLQATTTTLYLAKKLIRSGNTEDRNEALGLLEGLDNEVYYMDKIVSDLQDYAGPAATELSETNLLELFTDVISSMKIPRTVRVCNLIEGVPLEAIANPLLLRRVLVNIILNAVQAMPKGGELTINGSEVQGNAFITVQDTGMGIPPENLEKIFNPFFTTKAQGQGLGLTVCKRLVEAQGGEITVKSELGKGSTFTVKLRRNVTSGVN